MTADELRTTLRHLVMVATDPTLNPLPTLAEEEDYILTLHVHGHMQDLIVAEGTHTMTCDCGEEVVTHGA